VNATVQEVAGGYALRLERHLRHPIEEVWAAIAEYEVPRIPELAR
jgi:uncharacterized protein YndB with AHSA1/START domain